MYQTYWSKSCRSHLTSHELLDPNLEGPDLKLLVLLFTCQQGASVEGLHAGTLTHQEEPLVWWTEAFKALRFLIQSCCWCERSIKVVICSTLMLDATPLELLHPLKMSWFKYLNYFNHHFPSVVYWIRSSISSHSAEGSTFSPCSTPRFLVWHAVALIEEVGGAVF